MRKINRVASVIVLVSFLLNSVVADLAFSQSVNYAYNSDKLSPPLLSGSLGDTERSDIAKIDYALRCVLKETMDDYETVEDLTALLNILQKQNIKEQTTFRPSNMQFFFNEKRSIPYGYSVMCRITDAGRAQRIPVIGRFFAKPRTYYVVFSKDDDKDSGTTFPVRPLSIKIYTEEEFNTLHLMTTPKEELPVRNSNDVSAIQRYVRHEEGIDAVIRYAHENGLAKEPLKERFDYSATVTNLLSANALNITVENPDKLIPLQNRRFYLVKRTEKLNDMIGALPNARVIDESGVEHDIAYSAHSSNSAVHVFVSEEAFRALTEKGVNTHDDFGKMGALKHEFSTIISDVTVKISDEIGVMLGQSLRFDKTVSMPLNSVGRRYRDRYIVDENDRRIFSGVMNELRAHIVDLDKNLLVRDYAAGVARNSASGNPADDSIACKKAGDALAVIALSVDLKDSTFKPKDYEALYRKAQEDYPDLELGDVDLSLFMKGALKNWLSVEGGIWSIANKEAKDRLSLLRTYLLNAYKLLQQEKLADNGQIRASARSAIEKKQYGSVSDVIRNLYAVSMLSPAQYFRDLPVVRSLDRKLDREVTNNINEVSSAISGLGDDGQAFINSANYKDLSLDIRVHLAGNYGIAAEGTDEHELADFVNASYSANVSPVLVDGLIPFIRFKTPVTLKEAITKLRKEGTISTIEGTDFISTMDGKEQLDLEAVRAVRLILQMNKSYIFPLPVKEDEEIEYPVVFVIMYDQLRIKNKIKGSALTREEQFGTVREVLDSQWPRLVEELDKLRHLIGEASEEKVGAEIDRLEIIDDAKAALWGAFMPLNDASTPNARRSASGIAVALPFAADEKTLARENIILARMGLLFSQTGRVNNLLEAEELLKTLKDKKLSLSDEILARTAIIVSQAAVMQYGKRGVEFLSPKDQLEELDKISKREGISNFDKILAYYGMMHSGALQSEAVRIKKAGELDAIITGGGLSVLEEILARTGVILSGASALKPEKHANLLNEMLKLEEVMRFDEILIRTGIIVSKFASLKPEEQGEKLRKMLDSEDLTTSEEILIRSALIRSGYKGFEQEKQVARLKEMVKPLSLVYKNTVAGRKSASGALLNETGKIAMIFSQARSDSLREIAAQNLSLFTHPDNFKARVADFCLNVKRGFSLANNVEKKNIMYTLSYTAYMLSSPIIRSYNLLNPEYKSALTNRGIDLEIVEIIKLLSDLEGKEPKLAGEVMDELKNKLAHVQLKDFKSPMSDENVGIGLLAEWAKEAPAGSLKEWTEYWTGKVAHSKWLRTKAVTEEITGNDYGPGTVMLMPLGVDLVMMNPTLARRALKENPDLQKKVDDYVRANAGLNKWDLLAGATKIAGLEARVALRGLFHITGGKRGRVSFQVNARNYNEPKKMVTDILRLGIELDEEGLVMDEQLLLNDVLTPEAIEKNGTERTHTFFKIDSSSPGVYGKLEKVILDYMDSHNDNLKLEDIETGGVIEKVLAEGRDVNGTVAGSVSDGIALFLAQIIGHRKAAKNGYAIHASIITKMAGRVEASLRWYAIQKVVKALQEKGGHDQIIELLKELKINDNGMLDDDNLRVAAKIVGLNLPSDKALRRVGAAICQRSNKIMNALMEKFADQGVSDWETGDLLAATREAANEDGEPVFAHFEYTGGMYSRGWFPRLQYCIESMKENIFDSYLKSLKAFKERNPKGIYKQVEPELISEVLNSCIGKEFRQVYELNKNQSEILKRLKIDGAGLWGKEGLRIVQFAKHPFAQQTLFGKVYNALKYGFTEKIPRTEAEKDAVKEGFTADCKILADELEATAQTPRYSASGSAKREIEDVIAKANDAGLQIPTHPDQRYTLLLPNEFYANGEFDVQKSTYGDRFDLDRVSGENSRQFIGNILAKAKDNPARTIVLIARDDITNDQLTTLTDAGIRFIRTTAQEIGKSKDAMPEDRKSFQLDTYVMMLLARNIDKEAGPDSPIYRMLSFYLRSHFNLGDIAVTDYIQAIATGDIARLIKAYLTYKPAERYELPEYRKIAATLVSA
ncbi:MAG: hypothetical protein Q7S30_05360 [Candidatus Omnitrophota bacterium]|nr:hypothetical protein [Candidatus Omnitrophota bacterium]